MNFLLFGEFNEDLLNRFVQFVNTNKGIEKNIYLDSNGGKVFVMEIILDIINRNPDEFKIFAVEEIGSSAFILFLHVKCKRKLGMLTRGMYHLTSREIRLNSNGKGTYHHDEFQLKTPKLAYQRDLKIATKLGLTKDEMKRFKKGEEIYFDVNRIKQFLDLKFEYILEN